MYREIDVDFIEFYVKKKYNQRLHDYFEVSRPVASTWRNEKFPDGRLMEFVRKEGSMNIIELFNNLYKRD
jgi:hypothetical protein